ncbi:MAG: ATP-binding protein [Halobacteriota archaeon]
MPTGIKPRVNKAREFLEIAKDFKDPKEIIREALSNSWDAEATTATLKFHLVRLPGTRRKNLIVEIIDDGKGMSSMKREGIDTSEIEDFFNLGDSNKPYGSIGTKGHGTKIYYKSSGIAVDTWKNGKHIHAETEVPPWESLKKGIVPTYKYDEDAIDGKGTKIVIDGFEGKKSEFASIDALDEYISWYTIVGSFGPYFRIAKRMDVELQPTNRSTPISIPFGYKFPEENTDLSRGSENYVKIFGPTSIDCGETEKGVKVTVNIIGAILGEEKRESVPHTYEMMGLWLCKDFVRVQRDNLIMEKVFKGQYWYRNMLIFANCQQFDLTANRNDIRSVQDEYFLAIKEIKEFVEKIRDSPDKIAYFVKKKEEEELKRQGKEKEEEENRIEEKKNDLEQRLNEYKGRPDLYAPKIVGAPLKEPKSEAETALLLQAMISSKHPRIDFVIGEYKTSHGTDLLVEYKSKGIPSFAWVEIVSTLENLFTWSHPPERIHKVICWELGKIEEKITFGDGKEATVTKKGDGRYHLNIGEDSIEVYVLREIIQAEK